MLLIFKGEQDVSILSIKSSIVNSQENKAKLRNVLSVVLTPIGNCKPLGKLSAEKEKLFSLAYENVKDIGAIVSFFAERGLTELDDTHFVFTFVLLLEKFLHKRFFSEEAPKGDFVKDAAFLRESLNALGPQLCRIASSSLKVTNDGVLPTRLCAAALDLTLSLSIAFCTNINNSIVVEHDDAYNLESLQSVTRLFRFVTQTQEKIFAATKPLYVSGLSKAGQVTETFTKDISHVEPLFAQYMALTESKGRKKDPTLEVQRIIGLFGNPSRRVIGLVCLCLFLGRSSRPKKDVGCMVLTQIKELIAADSELGTRLVKTLLPLDNLVEEETIVVRPLLEMLDESTATDCVLDLVGDLSLRHQEEVVGRLFEMMTSEDSSVRKVGIRVFEHVMRKAESSRSLSLELVDRSIDNIPLLSHETGVPRILSSLGDPAYTLIHLVPYLGSASDDCTRSAVEAAIVAIMGKSVSELAPEESVSSAIRSYADAMRMKKTQSSFVVSLTMSPADLCKLHLKGKDDFSEEFLKLVPRWCHELFGAAIVGVTAKVLAAPGDTTVVQFFKALAPHFQEEDVGTVFIPYVTAKLESQKKLTEEMLDSPCGKEQVTALLFERISPLLAMKMALGCRSVVVSDDEARKRLEDALIERVTSFLEFDEVRRVAAEVAVFVKPSGGIFEKLTESFTSLCESVMKSAVRDDDTQIVLRAVVYALGAIVKSLNETDELSLKCCRMEEVLWGLVERKMKVMAPALIGTIYDLLGVLLTKSKDYEKRIGEMVDEMICGCSVRGMMASAVLSSVAKDLNEGKKEFVSLVVPKVITKFNGKCYPSDYVINVKKYTTCLYS